MSFVVKRSAVPDWSLSGKRRCVSFDHTPAGVAGPFSNSWAGSYKSAKAGRAFRRPEAVFRASLTELEGSGIQAVSAQSLATGKSGELAREELAQASPQASTSCRWMIPRTRPAQGNLRSPLVLYVRGTPEVLTRPGIAMVGTRHPTPYGLGMAERLACDLAAQGLVIISGMARGVDTASHRGAISAKGRPWQYLALASTSSIPKKILDCPNRFSPLMVRLYLNFLWEHTPRAELSYSQQDHQRHVIRCARSRGC